MAKGKLETRDVPRLSEGTRASTDVRIDAPHILVKGKALPESRVLQPEPVLIHAGQSGDASPLAQQLRTHAAQLAEHLEARQREMDHREADLNAQSAECEAHARNTRLALAQRRSELDDREAQWAQQRREDEADLQHCHVSWEREYQERVAALEKKENALAGGEQELQKPEEQLRYQKQQLDCLRLQAEQTHRQMLDALEKRRLAVEEEASRLREQARQPSPELLAREERLRMESESLQARQERLRRAEAKVASLRDEVETLHQQVLEDRRKWQEQVQTDRQRLAAERRREMDDLEQKRLALRRRGEQVDRSRVALHQMREDLRRTHRETLEIRLASEELWVQLSETAPAAVANRLLEQLRAKLADQYRLAGAELAEQNEELLSLRAELADLHRKAVCERQDFQQWAARRQAETERKAAELAAQQEQLDRRDADLLSRSLQWQRERLELPRAADHRSPDFPERSPTAAAG
jgi:hypothetical protein